MILFLAAGCSGQPATKPTETATRSLKRLVIIVPGTFGNDDTWPVPDSNEVTFASRLQESAGPSSTVLPIIWTSDIWDEARLVAAEHLTGIINQKASQFDEIYLVAHSHGGNVALLASGMANHRIAGIVCLATPHIYLRTRDSQGKKLNLPVYFSPAARKNVDWVVAAVGEGDEVPETYVNFATGVSEADAIRLTEPWQDKMDNPRLENDSVWLRLTKGDNVFSSKRLNTAKCNTQLDVGAKDFLGLKAHHAIHSPEIGVEVGKLILGKSNRLCDPAKLQAGGTAASR